MRFFTVREAGFEPETTASAVWSANSELHDIFKWFYLTGLIIRTSGPESSTTSSSCVSSKIQTRGQMLKIYSRWENLLNLRRLGTQGESRFTRGERITQGETIWIITQIENVQVNTMWEDGWADVLEVRAKYILTLLFKL